MQNLRVYKNFVNLPIKKIVRGLSEEIRETPTLQLKLMLRRTLRNVFMLVALTLGCSLFTLP